MYCNCCHCPCSETDRFCINCGAPLGSVEKKGRHWVPLLIMAVLFFCCTALFYAIPMEDTPSTKSIASYETPWFSLENGVLSFDQSKYTGSPELTVPAQIGGMEVVAIGDGCFENCGALTAIHLPDGLKAIGEEAFEDCAGLRGMKIPESVAFLGEGAFDGCSSLEAVCISNQTQHLGDNVFNDCTSLRYVYFLGNFQEWTGIYQDFIDPSVIISCEDGKFHPSGDPA